MTEATDNPLGRFVEAATRIKPNELKATLLSFAFIFLLMFAYNMLKPVRDALAPQWSDLQVTLLWFINLIFSAIAVSIYGVAVSRGVLRKVIPGLYAFFAASFVLFYIAARSMEDVNFVNQAFYVWLSTFSLFHVSVFWSLMSDLFTREQAPRLFAFIASGASVGTIAGALVTLWLVERIGVLNLMLIAATILVATVPLITYLRTQVSDDAPAANQDESVSGNPFAGFREFIANPYLLGIAVFIFLYTFIGSFAYFELKNLMEGNTHERNTEIWAGINLAVNVITIVTAWFVTSHVTTFFGVGKTLALVPLLVAVALVAAFVNPVLIVVIVAWVVLKAGNYSITRPGREMLYTNVSREDRFKTKQVIDIVVYRGGDVFSALVFTMLTTGLGLGMGPIAIIGAGVALLWAFVGMRLGKQYDRSLQQQKDHANE